MYNRFLSVWIVWSQTEVDLIIVMANPDISNVSNFTVSIYIAV